MVKMNERRRRLVNIGLIILTGAGILAGLLSDQWIVVLRNALLL